MKICSLFAVLGMTISNLSCSSGLNKAAGDKEGANESTAPSKEGTVGPNPRGAENSRVYFSFGKAGPKEPTQKKEFLKSQAEKVKDAVSLAQDAGKTFKLDVTLDETTQNIAWVKSKLKAYSESLNPSDTFVYYSHTHGVDSGIQLDFTSPGKIEYKWTELAQAILALPAKNVVVFVMACHSGYLVDALNAEKAKWEGKWASSNRNLVILTAVAGDQESFPTDTASNSETSIGNPFSYAVANAFKGNADGILDGTKDGKTSYKELVTYVLKTAKEKSKNQYANPQFVGEYSDAALFLGNVDEPQNAPQVVAPLKNKIDQIMANLIDNTGTQTEKIPGAVIGVVKGPNTQFFNYGTTQISLANAAPNPKTLFSIGSVTKSLTGLLLAREIHNHRLTLNTKAKDVLPPSLSLLDERITLKHLVSHSSTLKSMPENLAVPRMMETNGNKVSPPWWSPAKAYTTFELGMCLANGGCKPSAEPGSKSVYSNLGMGILGIALQTKLGYESFDRMVTNTFGKELQMLDTTIPSPEFIAKNQARIAAGYCNPKHGTAECTSPTILVPELASMGELDPAGGLVSTASDMSLLLKALIGKPVGSDWKPTIEVAATPLIPSALPGESTAYGFNVLTQADGTLLYLKIGETAGHTAMIVWSPAKSVGIVVLINRGYFSSLKETALEIFKSVANE